VCPYRGDISSCLSN